MTAADILCQAATAGLTFAMPEPGKLRVRGNEAVVARWLPAIRQAKPELLRILADPPPLTADDLADIEEAVAERAAIQEFDGHIPRPEAERQARASMRTYRASVAMPAGHPGEPRWVTMLLPGVETLAEARAAADWRFGPDRVLGVKS
jgi:hypothetical protein